MAAAIVLTQVHSRLRTIFYSVSIMPVLFPGVIIGISTVVLWYRIATIGGEGFIADIGRNGIFLTILGQKFRLELLTDRYEKRKQKLTQVKIEGFKGRSLTHFKKCR